MDVESLRVVGGAFKGCEHKLNTCGAILPVGACAGQVVNRLSYLGENRKAKKTKRLFPSSFHLKEIHLCAVAILFMFFFT